MLVLATPGKVTAVPFSCLQLVRQPLFGFGRLALQGCDVGREADDAMRPPLYTAGRLDAGEHSGRLPAPEL